MGFPMSFVVLGKKAELVIPKSVRKQVSVDRGDVLEVVALRRGEILLRKADDLAGVRKMMAGRLPQWSDLEGRADGLLDRETEG